MQVFERKHYYEHTVKLHYCRLGLTETGFITNFICLWVNPFSLLAESSYPTSPPDWKRPIGRPSHTWVCAIEAGLGPLNFGLATAWRKATTRDKWRHIVDTATLQSTLQKKESCIAGFGWS